MRQKCDRCDSVSAHSNELQSALDTANERGDKLAAELRRWIDKDIAAEIKIKEIEFELNAKQRPLGEQVLSLTIERDAALARVKELELIKSFSDEQQNALVAAVAKIKDLEAKHRDHEDDWKRIQDAERKCEALEARVKELESHIKLKENSRALNDIDDEAEFDKLTARLKLANDIFTELDKWSGVDLEDGVSYATNYAIQKSIAKWREGGE